MDTATYQVTVVSDNYKPEEHSFFGRKEDAWQYAVSVAPTSYMVRYALRDSDGQFTNQYWWYRGSHWHPEDDAVVPEPCNIH